ncbi:hypothetical protein PGTUg99_017076 [Puccinia graminis f. sp. tritici]|uniref:Uncharacterized protein n=2 Tax=Puccinia graminis f. sp. tritici TaxID=56615 RepID=A0A5B0MT16_PUCGR|nr:hypothetical protein PGTUg99_017076 [Puccinia graminis f. sp. tritici]
MPIKRNSSTRKPRDYDEYESTSSSDLESDIDHVNVPTKRNRSGVTRSSWTATTLPDATNRTQQGRRARCSTVSTGGNLSPPASRISGGNPAAQNGKKATGNQSGSAPRRVNNAISAAQRKKLEEQADNAAKQRRKTVAKVLSDRIMSDLMSIGIISRDVAQVCSSKLGWNEDEWKTCMNNSKVIVYEPLEVEQEVGVTRKRAYSSARRPLSVKSKVWSVSLEVDALSLCITNAGGNRVRYQDGDNENRQFRSHSEKTLAWSNVDDLSEVKSVFVHRSVLKEFLWDGSPSLVDLVRKEPRAQIFTFGCNKAAPASLNSPESNPRIEMILCAGAVIVPTFDSLFKNPSDDDQKRRQYFQKIKAACHTHPFLKICLHPSMKTQLYKNLEEDESDISMEFIIDFLKQQFDCPKEANVSMGDWIKLDRNIIAWLSSDSNPELDEDCDEDVAEVTTIARTLKLVQKELYSEFRRFIIAIPEGHPYADRKSFEGVELMKISELFDFLPGEQIF